MTKLPMDSAQKQIAALVKEGLRNAGHETIPFDEGWFNKEPDNYPNLSLDVPVGPLLTITVRPGSKLDQVPTSNELEQYSGELIKALLNLYQAGESLRAYHAKMSSAAKRQVNKAQGDGVQLSLVSVGFKSVLAWHLTSESWKDASDYVLAEVRLNVKSRIRGEDDQEIRLIAEETDDLEEQIEAVIEDWRDLTHDRP